MPEFHRSLILLACLALAPLVSGACGNGDSPPPPTDEGIDASPDTAADAVHDPGPDDLGPSDPGPGDSGPGDSGTEDPGQADLGTDQGLPPDDGGNGDSGDAGQPGCQDDGDCPTGAQPWCDVITGACVECLDSSHCFDAQVCHADGVCGDCSEHAECVEAGWAYCKLETALCVDCLSDTDCPAPTVCIDSVGACGSCLLDSDCPPATPICDDTQDLCVECTEASHCTAPAVCRLETNTCGPCSGHDDCTDAATPWCDGGTCNECLVDLHCIEPEICRIDGTCGGCFLDEDCDGPNLPACEPLSGECVKCTQSDLCPEGLYCDQYIYKCVECESDDFCDDFELPACHPYHQLCVECVTDAHCGVALRCTSDNRCVECLTDADCADLPLWPACDPFNTCGSCGDSFDCTDLAAPLCDVDFSAFSVCTAVSDCTGDDAAEDGDDGPNGATDLTPAGGSTSSHSAKLCSLSDEADWYAFTVSDGDHATVSVDFAADEDNFDVAVFDETHQMLGESWWKRPEVVTLTFLPAGTYYIRVQRTPWPPGSLGEGTAPALDYQIDLTIATGNACADVADCAAEYDTQRFRGECLPSGACVAIDGGGALGDGERCDSRDDCFSGLCTYGTVWKDQPLEQTSTYVWRALYMANADTRAFCATTCENTLDCDAGEVCVWWTDVKYTVVGYPTPFELPLSFCAAGCSDDTHCPINPTGFGVSSATPWEHLACYGTGDCAAP